MGRRWGIAAFLFIIGAVMVLEGLFINFDWASVGIPSLVLYGFRIHHWEIGLGAVLLIGAWKVL